MYGNYSRTHPGSGQDLWDYRQPEMMPGMRNPHDGDCQEWQTEKI